MTGEGNPVSSASSDVMQLEWIRVRIATSTYLKKSLLELERFGGELDHLNHFLKRSQQIHYLMVARISANLVDPLDKIELRASLAGRVRRNVLNHI